MCACVCVWCGGRTTYSLTPIQKEGRQEARRERVLIISLIMRIPPLTLTLTLTLHITHNSYY